MGFVGELRQKMTQHLSERTSQSHLHMIPLRGAAGWKKRRGENFFFPASPQSRVNGEKQYNLTDSIDSIINRNRYNWKALDTQCIAFNDTTKRNNGEGKEYARLWACNDNDKKYKSRLCSIFFPVIARRQAWRTGGMKREFSHLDNLYCGRHHPGHFKS